MDADGYKRTLSDNRDPDTYAKISKILLCGDTPFEVLFILKVQFKIHCTMQDSNNLKHITLYPE